MLKWHVVHCHPQKEFTAESNLQNQGFITYMPRYLKLRRHARKTDQVLAPLFPRYLFVQFDSELDNWLPINNTMGISYLLRDRNNFLSSVADNIIAELQNRQDGTGAVSLAALELFKPGDKVRLLDGAFENHIAIYQKMTDNQRVELLINLIQQPTKLAVPLHNIEKV
jgi:transcriptional antiterminator RfaH